MTSCLCTVASPRKEGAQRWIIPFYKSWVSQGPEEGGEPPKVIHQAGPGQSPGALLEMTSISSAHSLWPAIQGDPLGHPRGGKLKQSRSLQDLWSPRRHETHSRVMVSVTYTSASSPSLATAFPACFGMCKCVSSTSSSWRSDGRGGPFQNKGWQRRLGPACPGSSAFWDPHGVPREGGRVRSTPLPVLMCSCFLVFLGPE